MQMDNLKGITMAKNRDEMLYLAVTGSTEKFMPATIYGPFVHWQAIADWLDMNPNIRDGYKWLVVSSLAMEKAYTDPSIAEANKPYVGE